LTEQVHQTARQLTERLERLESKLHLSLSMAANAVATQIPEDTAEALDGTMAMLVNLKGSIEQTHQAVAAASTEAQSKEVAGPHERRRTSPRASPRTQRRASTGERKTESSRAKRPSRPGFLSQPVRQAVQNTEPQSPSKGHSVAALRSVSDSPTLHSGR
jgi:hypothetical protein